MAAIRSQTMPRVVRQLSVVLLALFAALAACGSGETTRQPNAAPTSSPSANAAGITPSDASDTPPNSALEAFDGFHYSAGIQLEANDRDAKVTAHVDGDYLRPDKHSFIQHFDGFGSSGDVAVVIIGRDAWMGENPDWKTSATSNLQIQNTSRMSSADTAFFREVNFAGAIAHSPSEDAITDGRKVRKYALTKAEIRLMVSAVGSGLVTDSDLAQINEFTGTAWVDDSTGIVLRFDARFVGPSVATVAGGTTRGNTALISLTFEITHINDKTIKIAPPI